MFHFLALALGLVDAPLPLPYAAYNLALSSLALAAISFFRSSAFTFFSSKNLS